MNEAKRLIDNEIRRQRENWGLEHDIEEHGSVGLVYAARIISDPYEPSASGYVGDEWYFKLWHKLKDNPEKR